MLLIFPEQNFDFQTLIFPVVYLNLEYPKLYISCLPIQHSRCLSHVSIPVVLHVSSHACHFLKSISGQDSQRYAFFSPSQYFLQCLKHLSSHVHHQIASKFILT